jgi:two-component system, OmpR family, response regulator
MTDCRYRLLLLDTPAPGRAWRAVRRAGWTITSAPVQATDDSPAVWLAALAAPHAHNAAAIHAPQAETALILTRGLHETAFDGPILCIVPTTPDEETALLAAGASLCLPPDEADGPTLVLTLRLLTRLKLGLPRHRQLGDLDIDLAGRRARRAGVPLALRPVEFDLLARLAAQPGETVGPDDLIRATAPDRDPSRAGNTLAVHIHHLRQALDAPFSTPLLHTVPGMGYLLAADPPRGLSRRRRRTCVVTRIPPDPDGR